MSLEGVVGATTTGVRVASPPAAVGLALAVAVRPLAAVAEEAGVWGESAAVGVVVAGDGLTTTISTCVVAVAVVVDAAGRDGLSRLSAAARARKGGSKAVVEALATRTTDKETAINDERRKDKTSLLSLTDMRGRRFGAPGEHAVALGDSAISPRPI